jgi:alkylhydroperoxidase/carboxymuconolactone decarboxylase family protein
MGSYYESADLKKFAGIGRHAKALADDFFRYYGNVTEPTARFSKREKALIALAVSHAQKCPYCIDAYTTQCLESGANPSR